MAQLKSTNVMGNLSVTGKIVEEGKPLNEKYQAKGSYLESDSAAADSLKLGGKAASDYALVTSISKLNGSAQSSSTTFYAPTSAGTKNYVLLSNGSGAPKWDTGSSLMVGQAIKDGDGNDIASTYLPKSGGTMSGQLIVNGDLDVNGSLSVSGGDCYLEHVEADSIVLGAQSIDVGTYTMTFPTKSGTIALTSDIPTNYVTTNTVQTISGNKTFSGNDNVVSGTMNFDWNLYLRNISDSDLLDENTASIGIYNKENENEYTVEFRQKDGVVALLSDLNNYLPLAGGTMSGPLVFHQTNSNTLPKHYISAGAGFSCNSGLNGMKLLCCHQSDAATGMGQDLGNGSTGGATSWSYDTWVVAGNNSANTVGYLSFGFHTAAQKDYRRVGWFTHDGKFYTSGNIYEGGTLLSEKYQAKGNYLTEITKSMITTALGYTPPTTNTTYTDATTGAAGLMSAADKTKLDGIASGANNFSLPARLATVGGSGTGYADPNSALEQGWHYITQASTTRPPFKQVDGATGNDYRVMTTAYSDIWLQQIATDYRSNDVFIRRCQSGTWQGWTALVKMQQGLTSPVGTDNAIARWDATRNATIQDSKVTIDDNGNLSTTGTINSYTLAAACAKDVTDSTSASAISTGTNLVTERDVYYGLASINGARQTSSVGIYAPTSVGSNDQLLKATGTGAPTWVDPKNVIVGTADYAEKADKDGNGNYIASTYAKKEYAVYYITGNTTGTEGVWTGTNTDITSYYDGLTINYKIGIAGGSSTTTLNINGLGAKTCYLRGTTKITTQYAVGTMVLLSYNATTGAFYSADYDVNTQIRVYRQTTGYDADYPILVSRTKTASIATVGTNSSYENVYAVIANDGAKTPTINPHTGTAKFPGSIYEGGTALSEKYQSKGTIDVTDTTPTTATKYYPIYTSGTGANQTARANGEFYYYDSGTWSSVNIGTYNKKGILTLHNSSSSSTDRYVDISPTALSANRTLTIPDKSGTIALTSDIPTGGGSGGGWELITSVNLPGNGNTQINLNSYFTQYREGRIVCYLSVNPTQSNASDYYIGFDANTELSSDYSFAYNQRTIRIDWFNFTEDGDGDVVFNVYTDDKALGPMTHYYDDGCYLYFYDDYASSATCMCHIWGRN